MPREMKSQWIIPNCRRLIQSNQSCQRPNTLDEFEFHLKQTKSKSRYVLGHQNIQSLPQDHLWTCLNCMFLDMSWPIFGVLYKVFRCTTLCNCKWVWLGNPNSRSWGSQLVCNLDLYFSRTYKKELVVEIIQNSHRLPIYNFSPYGTAFIKWAFKAMLDVF